MNHDSPVLIGATEVPQLAHIDPSVQKGSTCTAASLADCVRNYGEEVTEETVLAAAWNAIEEDVSLRSGPGGLKNLEALENGRLSLPVMQAAMEKLGFHLDVAKFGSIETLKALVNTGEVAVVVNVRPASQGGIGAGGLHTMRVVDVNVATGKVKLANTHPTEIPGQEGGQILEVNYDTFAQQTNGRIADVTGVYLVRPKGMQPRAGGSNAMDANTTPGNPPALSVPRNSTGDQQKKQDQDKGATNTSDTNPGNKSTSMNSNTGSANTGTATVAVNTHFNFPLQASMRRQGRPAL